MMTKQVLFMFFAATAASASICAQNLKLSTATPETLRPVTFIYSGNLAQKKDVKSTLYYAVRKNIYAQPLKNTPDGASLKGSFTLPDSAQAFALTFKTGSDNFDNNNDSGYIYDVYKGTEPVTGAYAAKAGFYGLLAPTFGIDYDVAKYIALYKKEFRLHPSQKRIYWKEYYMMAARTGAGKDTAGAELRQLWQDSLAAGASENSLIDIYNILTADDKKEAAAYKKELLDKYPSGEFAAMLAVRNVFGIRNTDSLIQGYNRFKQKYPGLHNAVIDRQYNLILALRYSQANDLQRFEEYTDKIDNSETKVSLLTEKAMLLSQSNNKDTLAIAAALAKDGIDAVEAQKDQKPAYYTDEDWHGVLQNSYAGIGDIYAGILYKQGDVKSALSVQEKVVADTANIDEAAAEHLIRYYIADGNYEKALDRGASFVQNGKTEDALKSLLKSAYEKSKGSDTGFDAYYAQLTSVALDRAAADIKSAMIDKPAPRFTLKDVDGNVVSLDSLKGKVVVLDFWATWCGPCKMSFPGMQATVNKYKGDKDVVFLFIDTGEMQPTQEQRIEAIKEVMDKNSYTFHVLLDAKDSSGKVYRVENAYDVKGIPVKFVIDGKGNIRFTKVGFDGSAEDLIRELSIMIELTKRA